jgi:transcriptional regulator with XRE-family HTH domain
MGLRQLAERTGLSTSLLSRIENSKHLPTVPTLLRIAKVFNVTLDHFFRNARRPRVVSLTRNEERRQAAAGDPAGNEGCILSKLDLGYGERKFHPYLAEFSPGKCARPHTHQGFEFIHVLRGTLALLIGAEESVLSPGDSIYFDSSLRHSYRGLSDQACTALMVCSDPGQILAERRMDRLEDLHVVGRQSQAGGKAPRPGKAETRRGMEPVLLSRLPADPGAGARRPGGNKNKTNGLTGGGASPATSTNGGRPDRRALFPANPTKRSPN